MATVLLLTKVFLSFSNQAKIRQPYNSKEPGRIYRFIKDQLIMEYYIEICREIWIHKENCPLISFLLLLYYGHSKYWPYIFLHKMLDIAIDVDVIFFFLVCIYLIIEIPAFNKTMNWNKIRSAEAPMSQNLCRILHFFCTRVTQFSPISWQKKRILP